MYLDAFQPLRNTFYTLTLIPVHLLWEPLSLPLFLTEIFVSCPQNSSCFHEEKNDVSDAY